MPVVWCPMTDLRREEVVAYVRTRGSATSRDVADHFGTTVKIAGAHLERAERDETLVRDDKRSPHVYSPRVVAPAKGAPLTRRMLVERIVAIDAEMAELREERAMLVRAVGS